MENSKPTQIAQDVVVYMAYQLSVDGKVEEDYDDQDPIIFIYGHENIIPGLEKELQGLKIGDSRQVTVIPSEGYGDLIDEAVIEIPRTQFPSEIPLTLGTILELKDDDGNPLTAYIVAVTDEMVTLDFNHPMAGKTLDFSIKIVALRQADPDEIKTGQVQLD